MDIGRNNFVREDAVEAAWAIVEPILGITTIFVLFRILPPAQIFG